LPPCGIVAIAYQMERRPLLALGVAAATGAAIAQPLDPALRALLLAAIACCAIGLAMHGGEGERIRAFAAAALVAGTASAAVHLRLESRPPIRAHTTRIACTVLDAGATPSGAAYSCRTDAGPTLAVNGAGAPPAIGEHMLIRGRIEPFDGPRNPGEPDQAAIQRERGLDAHVAGAHILARLPPAPLSLAVALARMHAWALSQLRLRLAEPYASIVAGELWGERGSLPPELRAEFQETGTVHILVTAGLHLGVVAPEPNNLWSQDRITDLEMMAMLPGRERTRDEFAALFEHAGLRLTRVVGAAAAESILEAVPV
jgi:competence protein ComEC